MTATRTPTATAPSPTDSGNSHGRNAGYRLDSQTAHPTVAATAAGSAQARAVPERSSRPNITRPAALRPATAGAIAAV
jgi:hypothetical protein